MTQHQVLHGCFKQLFGYILLLLIVAQSQADTAGNRPPAVCSGNQTEYDFVSYRHEIRGHIELLLNIIHRLLLEGGLLGSQSQLD